MLTHDDGPALDPASGDLWALADATALAGGAPVTIEDASSRVLAFSTEGQDIDAVRVATILGRRVPARWTSALREQARLDGVLAAGEPAVVEIDGMVPRRVIAVREGGTVLGSIWLAGATPVAADDVLREAAAVAAPHLLRRRAADGLRLATRAAAISDLLRSGELTARIEAETELRRTDGFLVLAVRVDREGERADSAAVAPFMTMLTTHLTAFRRRAAHAVLNGVGYLVAASADEQDHAVLTARLRDGFARVQHSTGAGARAAVGIRATDDASVLAARWSAERALQLRSSRTTIVNFDTVHAEALVAELPALVAGWPGGSSQALRALVDHDRRHRTALVETLRVVFARFGDTAAAAADLHVHANTVRSRLRQALEVADISLKDGPARLALELELHALDRR